jgi:hypothetical protein
MTEGDGKDIVVKAECDFHFMPESSSFYILLKVESVVFQDRDECTQWISGSYISTSDVSKKKKPKKKNR